VNRSLELESVPQPATRDTVPTGAGFSLIGLANVILHERLLVGGIGGLGLLVAVSLTLLQHRSYTVGSTFLPQSRRTPNTLSTIAAQFGLSVPVTEGNQSPNFYADLMKSREVLGRAVDGNFLVGNTEVSLIEFLGVEGSTPALRRERAIHKLRDHVTVTVMPRTSVVKVEVRADDPSLAFQINRSLLDLVNRFNLESRRSQATAERQFTERRLAEVQIELKQAEDRLQTFLTRNRDYRNSPILVFDQDRLAREVAMRQQVFTSLAQAYEQAKIDEVRDTPVIIVVESPEIPAQPDPRGVFIRSFLGIVMGALLGALLALGRDRLSVLRQSTDPEARTFSRLLAEFKTDLRRPWRIFRR